MAEDSTPRSLVDLIEHANRLKGMRAQIVRDINELFATIAEVAENERDGKYNALIELTARMQDQRDEALARIQELESELSAATTARGEANALVGDLQRREGEKTAAMVNALTIRNAAVKLRNALHAQRLRPTATRDQAKLNAFAHELVVKFDEETAGMIRADEEEV